MTRVCVVGAGPAGLFAALHAAEGGAEVVLRERNDRCGVKLLTTGGGRCNVSNRRPPAEWPALFGRRGRFIRPALSFLPGERLASRLAALGQPLASPDGFHLFPASNSARAVRDALLGEALRLGVRVECGRRARRLDVRDGRVRAVTDDSGREPFDAVVLATGGQSFPATGSTGDGWDLAREAGHRIAPAFPGLVGLRAANLDASLAGIVLPDALAFLKTRGSPERVGRGELLLTHGGVSGPAVLDLSAAAAEALASPSGAVVRIRWSADADRAAWLARLESWRAERGGTAPASLLRSHLPQRLGRWLCAFAGVSGTETAANLSAAGRDRLAEALAAFPARVADTEGWERAMITRGGVDVRDVNPETLASRLAGGLYFAGEVLDVDGPCGGYNLHWAFASGALAGASAAGANP